MKVQKFLAHHGIDENPFAQEDAQTDHVFRKHCLDGTHHPAWDKIYGTPESPATSIVFGEKGSGKTALRLQIVEQLKQHNRQRPDRQTFVIEYDDFNPFLDSFRERLHGRKRKVERALTQWRLWDHMDAILSLGVTRLVDAVLASREGDEAGRTAIAGERIAGLSRMQKRDLLLLAAFYDHTFDQPAKQRWNSLRRTLKFSTWRAMWDRVLGVAVTVAVVVAAFQIEQMQNWWLPTLLMLAGWGPWLFHQSRLMWTAWKVSRQIRVFDHVPNTLRKILGRFQRQEIAGQPIPSKDRSDDRYELLLKLQAVLRPLGFTSMIVLVDRVDEPHLVNGSPERMRDLLWPMFDNKFLKHPGIGFKMMLPSEVVHYLNRAEKEFYERSRLDKQNLVPSLQWTGESLYDVANDRISACARAADRTPTVRDLFDESIGEQELIGIFSRLRVPRHLFKFLHRLLVEHCNRYTEDSPNWHISRETLQSSLAVFTRDLEALDRGMGTG